MPLELKGKLKPGEADRRYYMIRVQVDNRRVPISTGTRDRKLAEKKEQLVINALRDNPSITKAELVALVRGANTPTHRTVLRSSLALDLQKAVSNCWEDRRIWGAIKARAAHKSNIKRIVKYFGENRLLTTITEDEAKEFADHLLDDGMQPGGADRVLAVFQRLMRAALKMPGGPTQPIDVPLFGETRIRVYTLTYDEEAKFLKAIREQSNQGAEECYDLCMLLIETGMRLSEALNLRWGDIEVRDRKNGLGSIRLWRVEELKTKASVRTLATTPLCLEAIERRRGTLGGPFKSLRKHQVHIIWNKAKEALGVDDRDCVPHCCRHTFATRLLEETGDLKLVQQWLGHASIMTTARVYAKVLVPRLMDAAALLAKRRGT